MKQRLQHILILLSTGTLLAVVGCTDDPADSSLPTRIHELQINLGTPHYAATRAEGDMPTNFVLYNHETTEQPIMQIEGYLTYMSTTEENTTPEYVACTFDHTATETTPATHTWKSRVPLYTLGQDESYYLYGFMPKNDVQSNVTITPYNGDYQNGATMTIHNLNAVTPDDICVIVGAEGYGSNAKPNVPDMSQRLGVFNYNPETDGDKIFLLVDHLYARLQFNMSLGETYSKLRGIKVTKVELIPSSGSGNSNVVETVNATVKIVANSNNINPIEPNYSGSGTNISGEVSFTANPQVDTNPKPAELFNGEKTLTTTAQPFFACFCPATNKNFTLRTTYDVYDRKGNKIRKEKEVENAINIESTINAGQTHIINIVVQPTFLYMLSEPDLDNPTFEIQ